MKKQQGVTLLETILVLSLIAIIMVGGLSLYSSANKKAQTNDIIRIMTATISNFQGVAIKSRSSSMVSINKTLAENMDLLPDSFDKYFNYFDGYIVSKGYYGLSFEAKAGKITKSMCVSILTHDFGQDWMEDGAASGPYLYKDLTIAQASATCSSMRSYFYVDLDWGL